MQYFLTVCYFDYQFLCFQRLTMSYKMHCILHIKKVFRRQLFEENIIESQSILGAQQEATFSIYTVGLLRRVATLPIMRRAKVFFLSHNSTSLQRDFDVRRVVFYTEWQCLAFFYYILRLLFLPFLLREIFLNVKKLYLTGPLQQRCLSLS